MTSRPISIPTSLGITVLLVLVVLAGCVAHQGPSPNVHTAPVAKSTESADRYGVTVEKTAGTRPSAAGNPASAAASAPPQAAAATNTTPPAKTAGPSADPGPEGAPSAEAPNPAEPLVLAIDQAVLMAMENNRSLAVERLTPEIDSAEERVLRSIYDPVLTAEVGYERTAGELLSAVGQRYAFATGSLVGQAGIEQRLPTGTTVGLEAESSIDDQSQRAQFIRSRVGLTVTQALLRGANVRANLACIREARLDWQASQYELRGFAEELLAGVETAYWDCVLANLRVDIFEQSVKLAQEQVAAVRQRIDAGTLSETELVAAKASLAERNEELIDGRSEAETARLQLLRLVNPPGPDKWRRPIRLPAPPAVPDARLDDVEDHVGVALRMRPDLNQARMLVQQGDLKVVRTRDGLLPMLDLFAMAGRTGYAEAIGESWREMDGDDYDLFVGVRTEFPLRNRAARALHQQALLTRQQMEEAVRNLEQLVQVDVRTAYIEVSRATKQVTATRATRQLRNEALLAEIERHRIGRSTALDVGRVHRDLIKNQTAEAEATIDYLKALVTLFQMDGTLLTRRGVEAPGAEPAPGGDRGTRTPR